MSTNATTWFYHEPETGRPYLIAERVTHTFWGNRLSSIYFKCLRAESPYLVAGEWRGIRVEIEWEVKHYLRLRTPHEERGLITVCSEIVGLKPTLSFTDETAHFITEWFLDADAGRTRIQEVQGIGSYTMVVRR
jgi:hypothetical protein